jgi:hypothetical protein
MSVISGCCGLAGAAERADNRDIVKRQDGTGPEIRQLSRIPFTKAPRWSRMPQLNLLE